MKFLSLALLALAALAGAARADVLHVPKDFATIQAAVDAAVAGDEIVVHGGSYTETVVLSGKDDLVLRAKGKAVLTGGTIGQTALTLTGCGDIRIERLRIEAWGGDGVFIEGSHDIVVSRVRVEDVGSFGLLAFESDAVLFERCTLGNTGQASIQLDTCTQSSITRCVILDGPSAAVSVLASEATVIERVRADGMAAGIFVEAVGDATATVVERCLLRDIAQTALGLTGTGARVERNRLIACATGITEETVAATYVRNRLVNITGRGMYVLTSAQCFLDRNKLLGCGTEGIVLHEDVPGGSVTRNKVKTAGDNGFEIYCTNVLFDRNSASGATLNGFDVESSGNTFTKNKAKGNDGFDLFQAVGESNTYEDNHFKTDNLP